MPETDPRPAPSAEGRRLIEAEVDIVTDFQFLVQDHMVRTGIGRAELARQAGISRQRVWEIMKPGANPSLHVVARVAHAMGLRFTVMEHPAALAQLGAEP